MNVEKPVLIPAKRCITISRYSSSLFNKREDVPLLLTWFNLIIPAGVSNHIPSKVRDKITYPFPNSMVHPTLYGGFIYLSMLGLKLVHISNRGP